MYSPEEKIDELKLARDRLCAIHYSCESWYDTKDRPVAVACIAIHKLSDHSSYVFSLTDSPHQDPAEREKQMLERFYDHLRSHRNHTFVHWNMHSSNFGFEGLRARYRFLVGQDPGGDPPEAKRLDLDTLLGARFGKDYINHPKLRALASLNRITADNFLSGHEEAEKFKQGDFGSLKLSTEDKAWVIAKLLRLLLDGSLVTRTSRPEVSFAGRRLDAIALLSELASRIEYVRRQLEHRHQGRPTLKVSDEYDFQDLFQSLLRVFFDDIRTEEWVPSYAGSAARVDFVLPKQGVAIELKHTRESMTAKKLGDELLVDRQRYSTHPAVNTIVCIVLDRDGRIKNPRGVEDDLADAEDGLRTIVRIIDR